MTGLIYIVIIALWAAVLIPIWLRRHDQISEVRSTARFSSAMRSLGESGQPKYATEPAFAADTTVLARPGSGSTRPEVRAMRPTSDPRMTASRLSGSRASDSRGTGARSEGLDPSYERELARQAAATRRAVVLGLLSLILAATLVLAVVSMLPRWTPLLATLPVLAFVLASALTRSQRSMPVGASRRPPVRRAEPEERRETAAPPVPDDDWETWNAWDDDGSAWDAVPTTLPTYVTAARASAVPRGIDRSRPGEWTGEAMVETARSMRRRNSEPLANASAMADYSSQTTEIPAVRDDYSGGRAVNE